MSNSSTQFLNIKFNTLYYLCYFPGMKVYNSIYEENSTGIIPVHLDEIKFEEDDDSEWFTLTFVYDDVIDIEIDLSNEDLLLFTNKKEAEKFKKDFYEYVTLKSDGFEDFDFVTEHIFDYCTDKDYDFFYNCNMITIRYENLLYHDCIFTHDQNNMYGKCVKNIIIFTKYSLLCYYNLELPFCDNDYFIKRKNITDIFLQ